MRILVVEDEFFLAILLEEHLRTAGFSLLGPFSDLAVAIEASRREHFDLAILDVNVRGTMVYPLADELRERGIAFILLSGYAVGALPERLRSVPRVPKPYDPAVLVREIRRIVPRSG